MTNIEAYERLDQSYCTRINQLFWIAGSSENSDLEDLLEELDEEAIKECFPKLCNSDFAEQFTEIGITTEDLLNFDLLGFFAEIHIPKHSNMTFDDKGEVTSASISLGICRVAYVYAETLEELVSSIEKKAEQIFQEYVRKEKNEKYF